MSGGRGGGGCPGEGDGEEWAWKSEPGLGRAAGACGDPASALGSQATLPSASLSVPLSDGLALTSIPRRADGTEQACVVWSRCLPLGKHSIDNANSVAVLMALVHTNPP